MMNKKAGIQAFLNRETIIGFIILIIFLTIFLGGGSKVIYNIGGFIAKVPVWVWIGLAGLWLISNFRR
jgi:hypothetical protein